MVYCWRTSFEFFDKVVGNVLQVVLVGAEFIAEFAELGQQVFGDFSWETWGVWEPLKLHCIQVHRRQVVVFSGLLYSAYL